MSPSNFDNICKSAFDTIKGALGVCVDYFPKAGGHFRPEGPFADNYQSVDPDTEQVVSSQVFTFGLKLADIAPRVPAKGDKLRFDGEDYRVIEVREDGVPGVSVVLYLHKKQAGEK